MGLRHTNSSSKEPSVNIHKNARLTPRSRELLVERIDAGENPESVATGLGVPTGRHSA